jgi:hypothetical protein
MNDQEWISFLDSLTPEERKLAQTVLARLEYVLERFRSQMLNDMQHAARRSDATVTRMNLAFDEIAALAHELGLLRERQVGDAGD